MAWNASFEALEARSSGWQPCFCELGILPLPLLSLKEGCGLGWRILFHCSCLRLIWQLSSVGVFCYVCWQDWSRWGCGQGWYIQIRPCLAPLASSIRGWVGPSEGVCVAERSPLTRLLCVGSVRPWLVWGTNPLSRPLWFWCQLEGWGGLGF